MINIIILILIIIILYVLLFINKETYKNVDNIVDDMPNLSKDKALSNILKSVDNSIGEFKKENHLNADKIELDDPLLNEYLDKKIISDMPNVNDKSNKLPFIENDNYSKYNHQLRLLINSKKIKQDFVLEILKNKINYVLGTLETIKDIQEKKT